MLTVSAVQFFSEAFAWFARLSTKLPKIDFKTYFIVVIALLLGVGLIVGLTYFGSYRFKLLIACKKILRYLADADSIDDDNVSDFTAQCFSSKAPSALRDCWVQYLGVRFGYPSEIVSEKSVYDDRIKRVREVRASVYIGIALIMIAIFAFWGCGTLSQPDMGVIFYTGLLISGAVYLALVFINRALSKLCLETFGLMQEDLDAKVDLQVEKSYATDSSPLAELAAMLDEIIARNTAKDVGFVADEGEETPLEKLIADMPSAAEDGDGGQSQTQSEDGEDSKEQIADIEEVNDDSESVTESVSETSASNEQAEEKSEPKTAEESEDSANQAQHAANEEHSNIALSAENMPIENAEEDGSAEENGDAEFPTSEDNIVEDKGTADAQSDCEVEKEEQDAAQIDKIEERDRGGAPEEQVSEEADAEENTPEQASADESASESGADVAEVDVGKEPQVKYVVDGPVEDDDIVKPAKLVKLPNLVDYMLARNPSRNILVNISKLLITTHEKFKNSPQDVVIVENCMNKVLSALQNAR